MNLICGGAYAAILATFLAGVHFCNGLHIGSWLYVMLALYAGDVVYCIYMIIKEMNKRKNMLETMAATDILPYVRYARASVMILMFTAVITLFAILNTQLLFIVGPLGLVSFSSSSSVSWHWATTIPLPKNSLIRKRRRWLLWK